MQPGEYGVGRDVAESFDVVLPRVREALKAEGFGVMAEIDVQATLKEKFGVERDRYVILGACNPPLAHEALSAEPDLGVLLPCNLVVYENGATTRVVAVNAGAMLGVVGNPALDAIAGEVQARLARVLENV
jgi:uncharacterized protein (DUF302 family)